MVSPTFCGYDFPTNEDDLVRQLGTQHSSVFYIHPGLFFHDNVPWDAVSWACHGYDGNPVAHSYYGYSNWYLLEYPGDRLIRSYFTRAYDIEQVDKEYLPAFSSCYFSKATARFCSHYSCITWDVYPVLPGLEVSHCWYVSFRFGEALHPGPPEQNSWSFQLRNIVSADAHFDELFSDATDCTVWTETATTQYTQDAIALKCKKESSHCSFSAASNQRSLLGKPCVGRGHSSGVLCFSRRARQLSLHKLWNPATWSTGRVSDTILHLDGMQIRIIGVYGYHVKVPDCDALNDILLSEVFAHARNFNIPTLVVGDMNCDLAVRQPWIDARDAGMVDVAAWRAGQSGQLPQPTYRGKSRLDYIICNQFALRHLLSFDQDPFGYTDHAILRCTFDWKPCAAGLSWTMPSDLASIPGFLEQVRDREVQECPDFPLHLDAFQSFCWMYERHVSKVFQDLFGKNIPPKYLGRGKGRLVQRPFTPLSISFNGEVAFQRHNLRHRQRCIRWLRELQREVKSDTLSVQAHNLWRKVNSCPGFGMPFAQWVLQNDVIDYVPVDLPGTTWLQRVVEALLLEEELWTAAIKKQQMALHNRNMFDDFQKGGRQHANRLKGMPSAPLLALPKASKLQVWPLRCSRGQRATFRLLDPSIQVLPGDVLQFPKCSALVQKVQYEYVTLDCPMKSGMYTREIQHLQWCTNSAFIASQVQNFWDQWWNTSRVVNDAAVSKMVQLLPEIPHFDIAISMEELNWACAHLPVGKARGMDGFSNSELRYMPLQFKECLLGLFEIIHSSNVWPCSLTKASVTLLSKVAVPTGPADARPIAVLASTYRLWAKIQTKKALQHLLPFLPPQLYGSIPKRAAGDMAMDLQSSIELSVLSNQPLAGYSLDLSKAYNSISRDVLQKVMYRLGFPCTLVKVYMQYLAQLERYVNVAGDLFGPQFSSTGVPEGCPLAVVSMVCITALVGQQVYSSVGIPLHSYVDNWSLQSPCVYQAHQAAVTVLEATEQLAMTLSVGKSQAYSTCTKQRRVLRTLQLAGLVVPVKHDFKDLGVYFNACARPSAKGILDRQSTNKVKLQRLRLVNWPIYRKSRCLIRIICPAIFYGCEYTSFSKSTLRTIRGKFNVALWGKQSIRDHWIAPIVSADQTYEPFLIVLQRRLQAIKRFWTLQPDRASSIWNVALYKTDKNVGPFTYIMSQLRHLHWTPQEDGWVQIESSFFHIWWHDTHTWMFHAHFAWCNLAIQLARPREDVVLPATFDVFHTRKLLQSGGCYNSLAANVISGAVYTTRHKQHFAGENDSVCPACGQIDDLRHKYLHCPATAHLRNEPSWERLRSLPHHQLVLGIWDVLPGLQGFAGQISEVKPPLIFRVLGEGVHLFTDGSTSLPKEPLLSLSAWAIVLAETGVDTLEATRVWGQTLRGPVQTNNRAELQAVLAALESAVSGHIYTDSLLTYQGLLSIQQGDVDFCRWSAKSNWDLWYEVFQMRECLQNWTFVKVKSHSKLHTPDPLQRWLTFYNDEADTFAKEVNRCEWPQKVRDLQASLHQQLTDRKRVIALVQEFHTQVANITKPKQQQTPHLEPNTLLNESSAQDRRYLRVRVSFSMPVNMGNFPFHTWTMNGAFAQILAQFIQQQQWLFDESGYSILEFYLLFVLRTGWFVPINMSSFDPPVLLPEGSMSNCVPAVWVHETQYEPLRACRQSWNRQLATFRCILKSLSSKLDLPFAFKSEPALEHLGVRQKLLSIQLRPVASLSSRTGARLRTMLAGKSYSFLMRQTFSLAMHPIPCDRSLMPLRQLWLDSRKAARRPAAGN